VFLFPWKPWTLHYKWLFFICFRQVSIEQILTSIIHLAPCSQKIIDNENLIFFTFVVDNYGTRIFIVLYIYCTILVLCIYCTILVLYIYCTILVQYI
jgi:hypothetical protein